jgi:hypothetical protein
MEKCFYCGIEYHPMLRATLSREALNNNREKKLPQLITVCEFHLDKDGEVVISDDCVNKALADGYELRRDLTPRR